MASATDDRPEESRPHRLRVHFDLGNVALATAVALLVIEAFTFIDLVRHVLLLLVLSILAATAIEPLVLRLRRSGIGRDVTVLGVYVAIVGLIVAFVIVAGQAMASQVSSLTAALPTLYEQLAASAAGLPPGPFHDMATAAVAVLSPDQLVPTISAIFTPGTIAGVVFFAKNAFEVDLIAGSRLATAAVAVVGEDIGQPEVGERRGPGVNG